MSTDYASLAKAARIKVLGMVNKAQTSHIASNFSVIDIATVLYANLQEHDEVVWSKGWAAASIYYFLAVQGKIPTEDLERFQDDTYLGLAETHVPGVLVNGGSVGHGLSVAVGIALGKKRSGEKGTVYCIMSDGELNEGSTWEAAQFAKHHGLNNLVAIVDTNGWQAMGKTKDVLNVNAFALFDGWSQKKIDGHDYTEIESDLLWSRKNYPYVIHAITIKGKGVSFFSNHLLYHYKNISIEAYEAALKELNGEVLPEDLVQKLRSGI